MIIPYASERHNGYKLYQIYDMHLYNVNFIYILTLATVSKFQIDSLRSFVMSFFAIIIGTFTHDHRRLKVLGNVQLFLHPYTVS